MIFSDVAVEPKSKNDQEKMSTGLQRLAAEDPSFGVSTDNERIAEYCSSIGFNTDYRRPPGLSKDNSPIVDAVLHAIDWYEKKYQQTVHNILLLQPTSPIRKLNEICNALKLYKKNHLESLVSVTPMREHPFECIEMQETNLKWSYLKKPKKNPKRRQDYFGRFCFIDGSIYISSVNFIKRYDNFVVEGITYPFFINHRYSIDIDEPEDLVMAEHLIKNLV